MRFIPVCTGNIFLKCRVDRTLPVYPCVYREHRIKINHEIMYHGLSLCVQGTWFYLENSSKSNRFIPVCTGNIITRSTKAGGISVYPCVYREHPRRYAPISEKAGLSLCVQGTFIIIMIHVYLLRFIPVCTGNM